MPIVAAGQIAALATALSWTAAVMIFEAAGRRMGSLAVNLLRLVFAFLLLSLLGAALRGRWLPFDAGAHAWLWLSLSGLCGLAAGDLCLFRAFVTVGARVSMLVMAFAPALSAVISYFCLGEALSPVQFAGMLLTTAGICLVVLQRGGRPGGPGRYPAMGLLLAFGGALGQAGGMVLSKIGMGTYNPFAANQIRILSGLGGLILFLSLGRQWPRVLRAATRDGRGVCLSGLGAVFGPFLGVSLSLYALQHTRVGVAATIIGLVPVLIVPVAFFLQREPLTFRDAAGSAVAVAGTALLFL
jgi:drug/metabolite transporter (DMT)-like permease